MAYYNVCPNCGSNLDPGEKCTCTEEKAQQEEYFNNHYKVSESGQLVFIFEYDFKQEGRIIE